jgi:hypothetical protein
LGKLEARTQDICDGACAALARCARP